MSRDREAELADEKARAEKTLGGPVIACNQCDVLVLMSTIDGCGECLECQSTGDEWRTASDKVKASIQNLNRAIEKDKTR